MEDQPKGISSIWLIIAPVACCGLPLLLATGALSGAGAWLLDGGISIVVGAIIAAVGFVYAWKRLGVSSVTPSLATEDITISTANTDTKKEHGPT